MHISVLKDELINNLNLKEDSIIVDGTLGYAGDSSIILERIKKGFLFAFDQDSEAIEYSTNVLNKIGTNFTIIKSNFVNLKQELNKRGIEKIDGAIFDLGVSSPQLDNGRRGFSYHEDARLDMRMDKDNPLDAYYVVNNYDWIKDINTLDFLRDYGKFFNVNYMLDKDIVRRRLDAGITYTEFSYMILQALDFKYLHEHNNVDLQCAGSDQWGNITAGIDLIRKSTGDEVYGFTMPLVTDSQGNKFGKSEGNALWLDKEKTSSYELYQFFVNVEDVMVIDYLKIYTFLSREEIEELDRKNKEHPELREAHKALAREIITFLHGKEE